MRTNEPISLLTLPASKPAVDVFITVDVTTLEAAASTKISECASDTCYIYVMCFMLCYVMLERKMTAM